MMRAARPSGAHAAGAATGFSTSARPCACVAPATAPGEPCGNPNRVAVASRTSRRARASWWSIPHRSSRRRTSRANAPGTSPGCMSFPDDTDCAAVMPRLGLPFDGAPGWPAGARHGALMRPDRGRRMPAQGRARAWRWSPRSRCGRPRGGRPPATAGAAAASPGRCRTWMPPPPVPERQPDERGERRTRPAPLLRHAPVGRRDSIACASCHVQALAFTDGAATANGVHGVVGKRNAPVARQRRLLADADLGEPQLHAAGTAGAGPALRHRSGRDGARRAGGGGSSPDSRRSLLRRAFPEAFPDRPQPDSAR